MTIKAVIFDRDGTLNDGSGYYVLKPEDVTLLPTVKETLAAVKAKGLKIFVATQQSCIGKGVLSEAGLVEIHAEINKQLGASGAVDQFYHCPHTEEQPCTCRKPMPGMINQILSDHNLKADEVVSIGDALRDMQSSQEAGVKFAFVRNNTGKMGNAVYALAKMPVFDTLQESVESLLR